MAYLTNPLPATFKERLVTFVATDFQHLSLLLGWARACHSLAEANRGSTTARTSVSGRTSGGSSATSRD